LTITLKGLEGMDGSRGSKNKIWAGLAKHFRDALTGALEDDPTQDIRDGYHQKLDNEFGTELGVNPPPDGQRKDPIQIIREGYEKRLGDGGQAHSSISSLEDELKEEPIREIREGLTSRTNYKNDVQHSLDDLEEEAEEPIQHIRDTYNKIIDEEYAEPTGIPHTPQKESPKKAGIDPSQGIREAYNRMFDQRESNLQKHNHDREQLPWWKKLF